MNIRERTAYYLYVAIEQARVGSGWMGLMYLGYAVANVGAVMMAVKGIKAWCPTR